MTECPKSHEPLGRPTFLLASGDEGTRPTAMSALQVPELRGSRARTIPSREPSPPRREHPETLTPLAPLNPIGTRSTASHSFGLGAVEFVPTRFAGRKLPFNPVAHKAAHAPSAKDREPKPSARLRPGRSARQPVELLWLVCRHGRGAGLERRIHPATVHVAVLLQGPGVVGRP